MCVGDKSIISFLFIMSVFLVRSNTLLSNSLHGTFTHFGLTWHIYTFFSKEQYVAFLSLELAVQASQSGLVGFVSGSLETTGAYYIKRYMSHV